MADPKPNGLFITDDAGNVYYLRPEILAQAKMPDEDVKRLKDELGASSKGKQGELSAEDLNAVAGGANVAMTHITALSTSNIAAASLVSHPSIGGPVMTSTVMCPW
jgi:hypothetical protein